MHTYMVAPILLTFTTENSIRTPYHSMCYVTYANAELLHS